MSKTPRTDKVKMTALTERNYDKIKCVPVELSYQLESELADKDRRLAEARTEIERLALELENKQYTITCASEENQQLKESLAEARARIDHLEHIVDEMTEEQASLCAEGQSITELAAAKDKLIEQMREALEIALDCVKEIHGEESRDYTEIKAALAAERVSSGKEMQYLSESVGTALNTIKSIGE